MPDLLAMGFEWASVQAALERAGGDVSVAQEILLEGESAVLLPSTDGSSQARDAHVPVRTPAPQPLQPLVPQPLQQSRPLPNGGGAPATAATQATYAPARTPAGLLIADVD